MPRALNSLIAQLPATMPSSRTPLPDVRHDLSREIPGKGPRSTCSCQGSDRSEVTSSSRQNPRLLPSHLGELSAKLPPQTDGLGRLICRHVHGWPTGPFAVKCHLPTQRPAPGCTPCLALSEFTAPWTLFVLDKRYYCPRLHGSTAQVLDLETWSDLSCRPMTLQY